MRHSNKVLADTIADSLMYWFKRATPEKQLQALERHEELLAAAEKLAAREAVCTEAGLDLLLARGDAIIAALRSK